MSLVVIMIKAGTGGALAVPTCRRSSVSGMAGIARNMTGIATKMAAGGYRTHFVGKWDAGMASLDHTPRGRG